MSGRKKAGNTYLNRVVLTLFLCATVGFSFGTPDKEEENSCGHKPDKQARKLFEKMDRRLSVRDKIQMAEQVLELDSQYLEVNLKLADWTLIHHNRQNKSHQKPLELYIKIIDMCPTYHSNPYYMAGDISFGKEDYENAIKYLESFVRFREEGDEKYLSDGKYKENRKEANRMILESKFYMFQFANPMPFDPVIVEGVSSAASEVFSIIAPDGESIYYTRKFNKRTKNLQHAMEVEELTKSEVENGKFNKGAAMVSPFNEDGNCGAASISIDNKEMFLAICNNEKGCDIYVSRLVYNPKILDVEWTKPEALGEEINTKQWESQPSVSGNGNELYFSRATKDNGNDIFKSTRDSAGNWQEAVNIGDPINTPGNDKTPFIHPDGVTLYFSSSDHVTGNYPNEVRHEGHLGLGGYDLFFSKYNAKDSTWSEPKNLGYPINSENNEYGFYVSTDGYKGYFSSDRFQGIGRLDVYSFDLYEGARPEKVLFLKGKLRDENGKPIKNASLELKGVRSDTIIPIDVDTLDGAYAMVMKLQEEDEDFILSVKGEGIAFNTRFISVKDSSFRSPATIDFNVKPLKVGEAYRLNDIYFETDSAALTEESKFVISEFINYLKENESVHIGIYGHTDSIGDKDHNRELSGLRAKEVNDYIVEEGIDQQRLTYQGMGQSQPIESNKTPEGRARNRRTEFVIVSK
ncbi:MAG: OmpA family protein [Bacteroidetes bacterium]|nr:OmpA family protein [Bacteroidota bacterium]